MMFKEVEEKITMQKSAGRRARGGIRITDAAISTEKAVRMALEKQDFFSQAGFKNIRISPVIIHGKLVGFVEKTTVGSTRKSRISSRHSIPICRCIPPGTHLCSGCGVYVNKNHRCPGKK